MASGVPEEIAFATKPHIVLEQMRQAIVADIPMSLVLAKTPVMVMKRPTPSVRRFQRLRPPRHSSAQRYLPTHPTPAPERRTRKCLVTLSALQLDRFDITLVTS
jgi:SRSO17 transposase